MLQTETKAYIHCDNSKHIKHARCSSTEQWVGSNKSRCVGGLKSAGWRVMKNYTLCPDCAKLPRKYIEVKNG